MKQLRWMGVAGLGLLLLGIAGACADGGPVGPDDARIRSTDYPVGGIEATVCQNGREYPDCEEPVTEKRESAPCYYWMGSCGGDFSPSGGGGGGTPDGTVAPEPVPPGDDTFVSDTLPTCNPMPLDDKLEAFCRGAIPDTTRERKIRQALDRIANRGDECRRIADAGRRLLTSGFLVLYSRPSIQWVGGNVTFSGVAPLGGEWVSMEDIWTDRYEHTVTTEAQPRNLEHSLVHELEHHMGRHHVGAGTSNEDLFNTPHSKSCTGL